MSNDELTLLAIVAFGLHLLALGVAIVRRRPQVIARVGLIFAATILFLLAFTLHWPPRALNVPAVVLTVLELIIAAAAINAMRSGSRRALAGAWLGFGLHTVMSALAVLFVLTFRINRLM
jgi:hypothetical protein